MHRQQEATRQRATAADSKCYAVAGFPSLCVTGNNDAKADAERAEDDLRAQEDMAEWAKWITLFTGLQVVVGGFGIYWVRKTFDKAVEANEISRDSSERQLRAYLTVESTHVTSFVVGKKMQLLLRIKNTGQTPARNAQFKLASKTVSDPHTAKIKFPELDIHHSNVVIGAGGILEVPLGQRAELRQETFDGVRDRSLPILVFAIGRYEDVFHKRHLLVFRGYIELSESGQVIIMMCSKHNASN